MENNYLGPENSEVKIERSKIYRYMLEYTKPHLLSMFFGLILIALFTFVQILHPLIIMVSIDDLIDVRDRKIGVYEDYSDFSGIEYGGNFYSSISHIYKKPNNTMRLVHKNGQDFWVDNNAIFNQNSEIVQSKEQFYLKNGDEISLINKANDSFIAKLGEKNRQNLFVMGIVFIILLVFSFIFEYAQGLLISVIAQKIVHEMRTDIFRHLFKQDVSYFQNNPVGRLVTRVTNDINNISQMYSQVILYAIKDVAMMIGIAIIMFKINFELSIVTFTLFPVVILMLVAFRKMILGVQRKLKVQLAVINSKLSEYIVNMRVIQVFNVAPLFEKMFSKENNEYRKITFKMLTLQSIFRPLLTFSMGVSLAILMYYGSNMVISGTVQIGLLVAYTKYIRQFYMPLFEFSSRFATMQSAIASIERVYLIMENEAEITSPANPVDFRQTRGKIEFKHVSFSYYDQNDGALKPVLKDVSFKINEGETCAIVGHTGAGKSTLVNLLYRFYDPTYGEILIDDIPINEMTLESLREPMAMVLQDIMLFSDTVSENIRIYEPGISEEDIKDSAKAVNAHKFISHLEGGYNSVLDEGGYNLSMGERQLLSFARAIAHKPKILILDEASSNIDSETEALIQDAIEKMKTKRTMIVIAHRLSTIKNSDQIIVLDKGRIVEMGRHEELMLKGGMYKKLYHTAELTGEIF